MHADAIQFANRLPRRRVGIGLAAAVSMSRSSVKLDFTGACALSRASAGGTHSSGTGLSWLFAPAAVGAGLSILWGAAADWPCAALKPASMPTRTIPVESNRFMFH
jgi:hypothetical protein